MAGSVHDQAHLAGLFDAADTARLFTATAEVRAMMLVEGTLAKVQGAAGLIPDLSAAAIHRASLEIQIDPGALARETAQNGVSVPALVALFRSEMQAPEHAQFVHWGATSQDIIDTALMLRLRQACTLITADLDALLGKLADLAMRHAESPCAARTFGQQAAPTSFGAVVAAWGWPLLEARRAFATLVFPVSLAGAVGTASALGPDPAKLRSDLAEALRLSDPARGWHTDRTYVHQIMRCCGTLTTALGKLAEDVIALAQSELGELRLGAAGASSTLPHKQNPVAPSAMLAVAHLLHGLEATLHGAALHRFQRDGAALFTEWMVVPQIVLGAATALRHGLTVLDQMQPDTDRMRAALDRDGLLYAETLSFALTAQMTRPDAQAAVKDMAREVHASCTPLPVLARAVWPDLPDATFTPAAAWGRAPEDARAFAKAVRA